MVHYFLVDLNDGGAYYRIGIVSDFEKEDVETFWQQYSKDVRFLCTKAEPSARSKGVREIPVGVICSCKFFCNKYEPFRQYRIFAEVDSRMVVVDEEYRESY